MFIFIMICFARKKKVTMEIFGLLYKNTDLNFGDRKF